MAGTPERTSIERAVVSGPTTTRVPAASALPRLISMLPPAVAAVVIVMAGLVLVGWAFDIDALRTLLKGGRAAMNPFTAVSFITSAVALWLLRSDALSATSRRNAGRLLAGIILTLVLVRFGSAVGWWAFRPDTLLFASKLGDNRMAPNTAMAFTLLTVSLLTLDVRIGRFSLSQPFVLAAACIAVLSLVGYLYHMAAFYGYRGAIPMSLNAAIQFLLLSAGIVSSRPRREPLATFLDAGLGGVVARRLVPSAFAAPLLVGGVILVAYDREWFDAAFGMAVFVLAVILIFVGLIWWATRAIRVIDRARAKAAQEQRLSEQRYHAIMRQTADGIYLVDLDNFAVLETNIALDRMLGYADGELTGRPVFDIINDTAKHITARLLTLKAAGTPMQGERQYRRKDGSLVDVQAGATVVAYGSRRVSCTVLHDITDRKRAQRLLEEKNGQLESAFAAEREALNQLRQAQSQLVQSEKLASLGQMVAGVAHEINNPLSFVSNNVAVLERDVRGLTTLIALYARADALIAANDAPLLGEIRDLAERMDLEYTQSNLTGMMTRSRDGLRRIQQIVKDLRDFARLDESDLHEVDLNSGIESTVNIVAGRAKKKRVELKLDLQPLPPVNCYPAKINQVVMNLVANAIDACPEGGGVVVTTMRDGPGVRIAVADNGPGVPTELRTRIFDPFFTTKPQGEGTGLGLSISYGIVGDHGGHIDIADAPGGGAVFTIRLPLVIPAKPKARREP